MLFFHHPSDETPTEIVYMGQIIDAEDDNGEVVTSLGAFELRPHPIADGFLCRDTLGTVDASLVCPD